MTHLQSMFTKEQLEAAASLGAQQGALKERAFEMFKILPDPLLSGEDVAALLHVSPTDAIEALGVLAAEGLVEKTSTTSRPLDDEGVTLYRLAGVPFTRLKVVGIESKLSDGHTRIQLTCDGRVVRSIAKVDRLDSVAGKGNQRDEIVRHVNSIARGIEAGTQIPNPVLLVLLAESVASPMDDDPPEAFIRITPLGEFTAIQSPVDDGAVVQEYRPIQIDFPYRRAAFDEEKQALLVDGQQRTAALSIVDVDLVPRFYLSVNAEVATAEEAKAIFMVANSTAKIETQFSRALLAAMNQSPGYLTTERPRVLALKALAVEDLESPFFDLVKYPGRRNGSKSPVIAYNSLFQVITVFAESGLPLGEQPEKVLAAITKRAFNLVKKFWISAWGLKPTESRLMHGIGLRSMASLIANKVESLYTEFDGDLASDGLWSEVEASLKRLQSQLVWTIADTKNATKAAIKFYGESISQSQNTMQDIAALTKKIRQMSLELDTEAKKAAAKTAKKA